MTFGFLLSFLVLTSLGVCFLVCIFFKGFEVFFFFLGGGLLEGFGNLRCYLNLWP